eukprot:6608026-Pyramimonas_sp.AAC.1
MEVQPLSLAGAAEQGRECSGDSLPRPVGGRAELLAGRTLHPSDRYLSHATADGRQLAARREPSRKGRENLSSIRQGLHPQREGAPAA